MGYPFDELDPETPAKLSEEFPNLVAAAGPALGEALNKVLAALASISPLDVMGFFATWYLTVEAGGNPEHGRPEGIFQAEDGETIRRAPP